MTIDLEKVARLHQEDRDLLRVKNAAYGNTGLRQTGLEGIATRVIDKSNRLLNLARNPRLDLGDEPIRDTLRDISNYGILGRMLDDDSLRNRPASVYLAGPIDLADPETRVGWQRMAGTVLGNYGVSVYAPYFISHHNKEVKKQIMSIGFHIVSVADMVLAYLPRHTPTLGTVREIHHAASLGKRVVVASDWAETSAFSADLECYPTVGEALCAILEIDMVEYNELLNISMGLNTLGEWGISIAPSEGDQADDSGNSNSESDTGADEGGGVRLNQDKHSRTAGHSGYMSLRTERVRRWSGDRSEDSRQEAGTYSTS